MEKQAFAQTALSKRDDAGGIRGVWGLTHPDASNCGGRPIVVRGLIFCGSVRD